MAGVNDDKKNQFDYQINYQIGERALAKRGGEPSFQFASVRCSVGKDGSDRAAYRWGSGRVGRELLPRYLSRTSSVCGYLGSFGDIWGYLQQMGMGGAPPAGAGGENARMEDG